jgi:NADPH:quinone reductase-like Zn-dependent oxidoreductase
MKAYRIHSYGHSDQLKLEEVPRPDVRPGQVLVRIGAAGVNPVDWKIREGYMKEVLPLRLPLTMGQDFSGEVIAAGPDVQEFHVGDGVFGFATGSYAEFAAIPTQSVAHMPKSVDFVAAAAIPTPGLTAYQIILDVVRAAQGQRILIHGAGGSVGSFAVQLAVWKKARVLATASSDDASYLQSLGVEQVIDYRSERFEEKVRDVDAVVDLVGEEMLARSYGVVQPGGMIVTAVGILDDEELRRRKLRGVRFVMKRDAAQLEALARLVDEGVVKVRVAEVLPFSEAPRAQDLNQSGKAHGKVVLRVA